CAALLRWTCPRRRSRHSSCRPGCVPAAADRGPKDGLSRGPAGPPEPRRAARPFPGPWHTRRMPLPPPATHVVETTGRPGDTLALTFDDGPHPVTTPALLDLLARHDVRAVFFL